MADMHWPDLHNLIPESNREVSNSAKQRQQNVIENSHIATWLFNKRFEKFFNNILISQWNIEDFWYRYE